MVFWHVQLVHLYLSAGHNYFGRHGKPERKFLVQEVGAIECVAGHGIRGDRFFDYKDDYKGQITFFAEEIYQELCREFGVYDKPASVLRRNVITRGEGLNDLVGVRFEIQGVAFLGIEECRPCYWMDRAFAPGTEEFLRGRGGLRARILSGGELCLSKPAAS